MKSFLRQFIILFLLLGSCPSYAQEQDEVHGRLAEYRDLCIMIRESVASNDLDEIANCIGFMRYVNLQDFEPGVFKFVQPTKNGSLDGHIQFTSDYLNRFVEVGIEEVRVEGDEHVTRSTVAIPPIFAVHSVIPAQRTCIYEYEGSNQMELLVVCEIAQKLGVKIDVASEGIHHQCPNTKADGIRQFVWMMNKEGKVRVSITNPGKKAVSVVIASN